jgi:hypothetical protein
MEVFGRRESPDISGAFTKDFLMRYVSLAAIALACALSATSGLAADPAPPPVAGQVVKFEAEYFKTFQVSTAYDMVSHVPGFVFDSGDSARGFAGTAGNVLIDGQRPATKADLGNTLGNINAYQVDRLELIIGGAPGIDMHGQREIVNIVRKTTAKPSLSVLAIARGMAPHDLKGVLLVNFNESHGAYSTDATADVFTFFDNGVYNTHRTTSQAGQPTDDLYIRQLAGGSGMESSAQHSRPFLGGKLSFNGTYNPSIYQENIAYFDTTDAAETFIDKDTPSELGAQYERKFAGAFDADLNVLDRHEREHQIDIYTDDTGPTDFQALILSQERIVSGKVSWQASKDLTFNLGAESAFNSRDELSALTQDGVIQGVGSSDVRVQEDRTESFASVNWQAIPKMSLEAELKLETSTISVPQDNRSDKLTYYKPRFQAVYTLDDKTKVSWKTLRQVDQLSFSQFASTVQIQTNQVTLGNTALVPQTSWLNTLILDRSFWDKGALSLAYEHYEAKDTSDFVAVIDNGQVYTSGGNIGPSQWDYLHLKLDLPLDRLGVRNGLLNVDWLNRQTRVKDPVTGDDRRISGVEPHKYSLSFSQEFPSRRMKWGFDIQSVNNDRNYLANELNWSNYAPWTDYWYEVKTRSNVTFRLIVKNPNALHYTFNRIVYDGLRDQSPVSFTSHQSSKIPTIIELRLKKDL